MSDPEDLAAQAEAILVARIKARRNAPAWRETHRPWRPGQCPECQAWPWQQHTTQCIENRFGGGREPIT